MENRAFILSGSVKSRKDNTPLANGSIILSVIDSISPRILYSRTDSLGNFLFYLSHLFDNRELILQAGDLSIRNGYTWELDNKIVAANHRTYKPYRMNDEEKEFLNTTRNIRLIEAVYATSEVTHPPETTFEATNYFSPADRIVYPGEYAELVNFKEIADNILPEVKFALRNDNYFLQVFNPKSAVWNECYMVLLNGIPFTDLTYIATLGTKAIERIEVIMSNFFLGDLTLPGLVSIYTYDRKVAENYLKNNTLRYENTVITDGSSGGFVAEEPGYVFSDHYPDFRHTLLWKPDVQVTGSENLVIEFPVSKLSGTYQINVRGLTSLGYPLSTSATFEVNE